MDVNARGAPCQQPTCTPFLPAHRQCRSGANRGKWYICYCTSRRICPPFHQRPAAARHRATYYCSASRPHDVDDTAHVAIRYRAARRACPSSRGRPATARDAPPTTALPATQTTSTRPPSTAPPTARPPRTPSRHTSAPSTVSSLYPVSHPVTDIDVDMTVAHLGGPRDQLPPPSFFTWRRSPGCGAPPAAESSVGELHATLPPPRGPPARKSGLEDQFAATRTANGLLAKRKGIGITPKATCRPALITHGDMAISTKYHYAYL
ncbi:hypothetical protein B0H14DRAFT_3450900 [Mycena olivaceomarginata]|nr:hypothetical protein B0H14DRAFT_3450900 [Mycena olivaceomarginata]